MKPRAIVFDLFGDYARYHGGELRLRTLVSLLELFGVGESTTRVVMARLRREGWFDTRREGRETVYVLNARSWRLLDEGRERIFGRSRGEWDGTWHQVIYSVPETERGLREELRRELAWLGFGPLAPSTWICPHDRLPDVAARFAGRPGLRLDLLRSRSSGVQVDREMAARCWDLEALDQEYRAFVESCQPRLSAYRGSSLKGAEALVACMRLVNDYRHFPFRDPDLPPELLPGGWHGVEAHELFVEGRDLLRPAAEAHFVAVAQG